MRIVNGKGIGARVCAYTWITSVAAAYDAHSLHINAIVKTWDGVGGKGWELCLWRIGMDGMENKPIAKGDFFDGEWGYEQASGLTISP